MVIIKADSVLAKKLRDEYGHFDSRRLVCSETLFKSSILLPTQVAYTSLRLIVIGQNNPLFPPGDGWKHGINFIAQLLIREKHIALRCGGFMFTIFEMWDVFLNCDILAPAR